LLSCLLVGALDLEIDEARRNQRVNVIHYKKASLFRLFDLLKDSLDEVHLDLKIIEVLLVFEK
jgi:hypothetical protein